MESIICMFLLLLLTSFFAQLSLSSASLLPVYNSSTQCHELTLPDQDLKVAFCLQRGSDKVHPYHSRTSPTFCSNTYPPNGHLLDLFSLSSSAIDSVLQSLTNLLNAKDPNIVLPEPNFLWLSSEFTQSLTTNDYWCPEQCQAKSGPQKYLILKSRCQHNNQSKPCVTTIEKFWTRAPFICLSNQTIITKKNISIPSIQSAPIYSNDTIIFYDSNSCLTARTQTHQYAFCFRRQSCQQSKTAAFCTAKPDASRICKDDKDGSNLLTIENDDEYQLVSDIISRYGNETILNENGVLTHKLNKPATWMWIDGNKVSNDTTYQWTITNNILTNITDKYWCEKSVNCSTGRTNNEVALSMGCQVNMNIYNVCLTSKRRTEPAPFICKRKLREQEEEVSNFAFLRSSTPSTLSSHIIPVYEKNSTTFYYDEQNCLTVQTRTHIYSFCLRRQNCTGTQAFCTKWSHAQKECATLKHDAGLLTIENEAERLLVTEVMRNYSHETRLTFNGSSYRFYKSSDFVWIDGVQQGDTSAYVWKHEQEPIPDHLWCPKSECNPTNQDRVMLNLACSKNDSLVCLSTRDEWKLAPYICKRVRPKDPCSMSFDKFLSLDSSEMVVFTTNRTIASIKCKHPEYATEVRSIYTCDIRTHQWKLIYENNNYTCRKYDIPPLAIPADESQVLVSMNISVNQSQTSPLSDVSIDHSSTIQSSTAIVNQSQTSQPLSFSTDRNETFQFTTTLINQVQTSPPADISLIQHQTTPVQISTERSRPVTAPTSTKKESDCSQLELASIINSLPTQPRYVYQEKHIYYASIYDVKITCHFNYSIQITYRCFMTTQEWGYVYGNTDSFTDCHQPCDSEERLQLLNKYFSPPEQSQIHSVYIESTSSLRLSCYNPYEKVWKSIRYKCGSKKITKYQWYKLNSCFQKTSGKPPSTALVSVVVNQEQSTCPPAVAPNSPCERQIGILFYDRNGCKRKVCPSLSTLCNTITCPFDYVCRVIPCEPCTATDYLFPVCEPMSKTSLCELQNKITILKDLQSINNWEREAIAIVQRYANEQRLRYIHGPTMTST